jgi:putative ABC transport system permease protein
MRDWKAELKTRLAAQRIDPTLHVSTLEELSAHLEELYRSRVDSGMTHAEADRTVLEELDDGALERELKRAERARSRPPSTLGEPPRHPFEGIGLDIRYAVRTLRQSPGFTVAAVMTLAIGIGANAAIFSIVNAVWLRPLPYPRADRIVRLQESSPEIGRPTMAASYPNFVDWRTQSASVQALGAYWENTFNLSSGEGADMVRGLEVMYDFFPVVGVPAAIGRTFLPEEADPARNVRVVVLSDRIWKRRFGSDPSILGRQLLIDGRPYTVIGVLPPTFSWGAAELFAPLGRQAILPRGDHRFTVVGRLRDGVTIDRARAELVNIAAALAAQYPENGEGWTVRITPLEEWLIPSAIRESLAVLLGAVFVVLIIACANVANLLLARAVGRQRELAVRVALGARGWRIVRQLITESVVLAGVSATIGLGVGVLMMRLLVAYGPTNVPRLDQASFDLTVILAVFAISLATVLIVGVAPAIQVARRPPSVVLQEATRGSSGGRQAQRWQSIFTVAEVAFSVALLIAAGLLLRSVWLLQQVDPGFNVEPLMAMRVAVPDETYATGESRGAFYERLVPEIQALPGIVSVATTSAAPLSGRNTVTEVRVPGADVGVAGGLPSADWRFVSPGYFSTMGIPIRGTDFSFQDREDQWPTTIISEAAARQYFPGQDAVGRQITLGSIGNRTRTVIAVVGDVRVFGLDQEPRPMVYYSIRNLRAWNTDTVVWRSAGNPASHAAAIRDIVRRIDPTVALFDVRTLDEMLDGTLAARRFNLYLLAAFAGVSLFLAAIGLFGVMAYLVSQRSREIGIRLALGAKARDICQLILGRGLALAVAGAAIGVASAFWLMRIMQSLVFAVSTTDPITFAAVPALLVLVALFACYVPARRAMRVDPVTALRAD